MTKFDYRSLDPKVMAVAKEGTVGDWAAYIGSVPGKNHEEEAQLVARRGTKLERAIAEILFPNFKELVWRD